MGHKILNNCVATAVLIVLILIIKALVSPWWLFVIPVGLFGVLISYLEWNISVFFVGFLSGFLLWIGAMYYFQINYNEALLDRYAIVFSIPSYLIIFSSGLIGGMLTFLSFYIGKNIIEFQIKKNH